MLIDRALVGSVARSLEHGLDPTIGPRWTRWTDGALQLNPGAEAVGQVLSLIGLAHAVVWGEGNWHAPLPEGMAGLEEFESRPPPPADDGESIHRTRAIRDGLCPTAELSAVFDDEAMERGKARIRTPLQRIAGGALDDLRCCEPYLPHPYRRAYLGSTLFAASIPPAPGADERGDSARDEPPAVRPEITRFRVRLPSLAIDAILSTRDPSRMLAAAAEAAHAATDARSLVTGLLRTLQTPFDGPHEARLEIVKMMVAEIQSRAGALGSISGMNRAELPSVDAGLGVYVVDLLERTSDAERPPPAVALAFDTARMHDVVDHVLAAFGESESTIGRDVRRRWGLA